MDNGAVSSKENNLVKTIALLVVEIFVLLGLIAFTLIVLNYFNILRIDKAFPIFSFLPHRSSNILPTQPSNTNSSTTANVQKFKHDENTARTALVDYINKVLQTKYIPQNFEQSAISTVGDTLAMTWQQQNTQTRFFAGATFATSTNTIQKLSIRILLFSFEQKLNEGVAESVVQTYFSPKESRAWKCSKDKDQIISCITNSETASTKNGFKVFGANDGSVVVFSCEIPQNSPIFGSSSVCFK